MSYFTGPVRPDSYCSTLDQLDLTTEAASKASESRFPTISGINLKEPTVLAARVYTTALSATVGALTSWHKLLGHPKGQLMANVKNSK